MKLADLIKESMNNYSGNGPRLDNANCTHSLSQELGKCFNTSHKGGYLLLPLAIHKKYNNKLTKAHVRWRISVDLKSYLVVYLRRRRLITKIHSFRPFQ